MNFEKHLAEVIALPLVISQEQPLENAMSDTVTPIRIPSRLNPYDESTDQRAERYRLSYALNEMERRRLGRITRYFMDTPMGYDIRAFMLYRVVNLTNNGMNFEDAVTELQGMADRFQEYERR